MECGSPHYTHSARTPVRPSSLTVGSPVYGKTKRNFSSSTFVTMPMANSRQVGFDSRRYQGFNQCDHLESSPFWESSPSTCGSPSYEESQNTELFWRPHEQTCPSPRTPERHQYERLYDTFQIRHNREIFRQSRYSGKSMRAGSRYWTPVQLRRWWVKDSTDRDPGSGAGITCAQESPSTSGASPCEEPSCDGSRERNGVDGPAMGMWTGNGAVACDKHPCEMTPSREAASGESERASLHTSEAACSIAGSPDSQAPPTLQGMFHPTPEMRDELASFEESWKAFLRTWASLLKDQSLDDNHAWPTLQQVLDKMMEQLATPDYSDKHSEFSHDSGIAVTGHSPAFSQPEEQTNSDDDVLNSAIPHYFSDCTSSTGQECRYVTADNKSLDVCYVSRPLKNTKSLLECDVDKILSETFGESPVNPFGVPEDNKAEASSTDVERQEMRAKSSYNEQTARCILPLDTFRKYSDHSSSDLTEVQSMTLQPSRENARLAGYQATLMNEFSEDNSPYDVMEWPSCAQATAVDNVRQSSWEGAFDDEEALKPEYSPHGKASPYANFYE